MKVESFGRSMEEFVQTSDILLGADEQHTVPVKIESARMRGEEIYLKLKGIDDKTAADMIRGQYLFVEESHRKDLPKEKFFIDELIGCRVVGEAGEMFGKVISVDSYPAHVIYTVRSNRGDVMLPAVQEFIVRVDVEKKEIVVRPPEGLFSGESL